jgi:hypothetical protein
MNFMGAEPWHYVVPYQSDINAALQALREQEFRAGRYGQALLDRELDSLGDLGEEFSNAETSAEELIAVYGSVQSAIEAVFTEAEAEGTASILDMFHVSETPEPCAVCPLSNNTLEELLGTDKPTRERVESVLINEQEPEKCEEFWDSIGRGEGRYILIYNQEQPTEIFFAGYSFD